MKTLTGLSKPVLNPAGEPLRQPDRVVGDKVVEGEKLTVGSVIASCLGRGSSGDPVRAMDVAIKIHNAKDNLELEDADFAEVLQAVKDDRTLNNMAKAAAQRMLDASQDAAKEKKEKAD